MIVAGVSTRTLALPEHAAALDWSPDGTWLAVALLDGGVYRVDVGPRGRPVKLAHHAGGALSAAFSSSGAVLATGGQDGHLRLLDGQGSETATREGGGAWVEHLAWAPRGDVLASAAGRCVRFWSLSGKLVGEFAGHEGSVTAMFWDADGATLTTACPGGVYLLRPGRKTPLTKIPGAFGAPVLSMAESPDSTYLALGHYDATVTVIQMTTGKSIHFGGLGGKVRSLCWTPDARYLMVPTGQKVAGFAFTPRGPDQQCAKILRGRGGRMTAIAITPGGVVLAGDEAGGVHAWSAGLRRAGGWRTDVEVSAMVPGRGTIAVAGRGGLLTLIPFASTGVTLNEVPGTPRRSARSPRSRSA